MVDDKSWISAQPIAGDFFDRPAEVVAPDLIGCFLFAHIDGHVAGGMIVETEAYDQADYAAHCYSDDYKQEKSDSAPMLLAGGHLYLSWNSSVPSINFICDRAEFGSAVLIRALEPAAATERIIRERRRPYGPKDLTEFNLCNGPANTSEALGIGDALHGRTQENAVSLFSAPFDLRMRTKTREIVCGPRIGIARQFEREPVDRRSSPEAKLALARHWRFGFAGSKFVSATFNQYAEKAQ
jgi:DNA-3-methyladenine glycosylase